MSLSQKVRGTGKTSQMKGQSLVFEQVLLFAVSIGFFVVAVAVFSLYQGAFTASSSLDQLGQVKERVASSILEVAGYEGGAQVVAVIPVPKAIAGAAYEVALVPEGLAVTSSPLGHTATSPLFQLNQTYTFSGSATSGQGKLIIKKVGGQITIG